MPRILSRSHMPSAAAARRRSSTASSSVRRNSLVDYSAGPRSPNRQQQQQHRQRPRRHSTETYELPPPEAVAVPLTVQSARNHPQHQQYESSTSFATAMTTSTQRTAQSVPTDFPNANIAAHNINSTTYESSGKPSSWQGVSPPSSGSSSAAWSFGLGTSAPSVGTTSTAYSGISSLSSSPGRGIGAGSDAVGAENTSRANPRRKPRRSRRHSADTVLGGGGFLPAPLKRNLSNDYGHFLEVAEEI